VHLLLVGVSHRTASIELRERLDFASRGLDTAVVELARQRCAREAAIVSTCNRAEIYVVCDVVDDAREELLGFLSEFHGVPAADIRDHLYQRVDTDAARHLFRVAAGLDSLVVGEPQILGQVKEAYAVASARQSVGPLLNRLFHWSFGVGKRVRSETALAEGAVSVSFAAVSLARKIFGNLAGRRVLVVGAGEMGKLTAMHLKGQGIDHLAITSRTQATAEQLAQVVGGDVLPWDALSAALLDADIVITATGAPQPVVTRTMVEAAVPASRTRPLFIIDIAVPRDVEPEAADIEQVFLYNIDDLQAIVHDNLSRRTAEIGKAEMIVDAEVGRFAAWQRSRGAIPTVVALRQRFEAIRRAELDRLEPKLALLPPEARGRVEEITRLIVEKLLLQPTEQLKRLPDAETVVAYSDALSRLFALPADAAPAETATVRENAGVPHDGAHAEGGSTAGAAGSASRDSPTPTGRPPERL
jgi:glutamyl-tRNA reductase